MIKVTKLEIVKFRQFAPSTVIELGDNVTLVAGCNGTGKSVLLGMIGQPLGFPDRPKEKSGYTHNYDNFNFSEIKTPYGKLYRTQYSDVFRISEQFDHPKELSYNIFLKGDTILPSFKIDKQGLEVRSEGRFETKIRFVTNTKNRAAGMGNFPHPVLFLGLGRLLPLAQIENIKMNESNISEEEQKRWNDAYRLILNKTEFDVVKSKNISTSKGNYDSIEAKNYDSESASAGEDNVGQILSAIISFYHLKEVLGEHYQGGVLLIDEIDATLHPVAQTRLLNYLIEQSKHLQLQIVATTHSIHLLKDIRKAGKAVKLVYLRKMNQIVTIENNYDFTMMLDDLAAESLESEIKAHDITTVLFEDQLAYYFFRHVTKSIFTKYINVPFTEKSNNAHMSHGILKNIAAFLYSKKIPPFLRTIAVLDPDVEQYEKKHPIIALPGEFPIEGILFNLIRDYDDNLFYEKYKRHRINCFNDYSDLNYYHKGDSIEKYKKWFNHVKKYLKLRINSSGLFEDWCKKHVEECKKFTLDFLELLLKVQNNDIQKDKKSLLNQIERKFK